MVPLGDGHGLEPTCRAGSHRGHCRFRRRDLLRGQTPAERQAAPMPGADSARPAPIRPRRVDSGAEGAHRGGGPEPDT